MNSHIELGGLAERIARQINGHGVTGSAESLHHIQAVRPPFPFKLIDDLDPEPRKLWLVRRMFGAGEFSVLYGNPGSGKSVLATDMAFHVAAGIPWMGRSVLAGSVLYLAAERAKLTERRLAALRRIHDLAEVKLAILDGRFDFFVDDGDANRLIATCAVIAERTCAPVALIVVDTVARVIPGADENHSRDIGRFVDNMDYIRREVGAHVMAIHHAGKDKSKGMRGSTALLGAADTSLFVEKLESGRFATVDKSNDEGEGETVAFNLERHELFVDPETSETTTAPVVVANDDTKPDRQKLSSLTPIERIALDCLHAVIDDFGRDRPHEDGDIPHAVARVVDELHWRNAVYKKTKNPDESEGAARRRFSRAKEKLIESKKIGKSGDWVWSTR